LKEGDYKKAVTRYLETRYQENEFESALLYILRNVDSISDLREYMEELTGQIQFIRHDIKYQISREASEEENE